MEINKITGITYGRVRDDKRQYELQGLLLIYLCYDVEVQESMSYVEYMHTLLCQHAVVYEPVDEGLSEKYAQLDPASYAVYSNLENEIEYLCSASS